MMLILEKERERENEEEKRHFPSCLQGPENSSIPEMYNYYVLCYCAAFFIILLSSGGSLLVAEVAPLISMHMLTKPRR